MTGEQERTLSADQKLRIFDKNKKIDMLRARKTAQLVKCQYTNLRTCIQRLVPLFLKKGEGRGCIPI